jgi:hypothetical protein
MREGGHLEDPGVDGRIGILRLREGELGRRKPGNAQWKKKLEIRGKDGRK